MADSEGVSSDKYQTPAETDPPDVAESQPTQAQTQNTQSPVDTYPELPKDWKRGHWIEDDCNKDRRESITDEEEENAWKVVNEAAKTYSDEMVQRWITEMDTLLVYAGLFSAVLTAFNVESYLLLSPTTPDPVLAALTQISAQLSSFSVHDPFVNSTQPAFQSISVAPTSISTQTWAVWLNALWFSSLICSLSAASIAIMIKQWISEYNTGISGASRHIARLRQHRYNGLVRWKVAAIIALLPILLQIAFGLFLAGLLVLLWNLNHVVAIVASTLVVALLAFTLVTIILPIFTSNCAYLSPLSISLFRLCRAAFTTARTLVYQTASSVSARAPGRSCLKRISDRLAKNDPREKPLSPTVYAMQSEHVTNNTYWLDQDVFVTAYSATGDLILLEQASTCFKDHLVNYTLPRFYTQVHAQNREYGQTGSHHWTHAIPLDMASDMLLLRSIVGIPSGMTPDENPSDLYDQTYKYLSGSHPVASGSHRISYVLSNIAAVLDNDGPNYPEQYPMFTTLMTLDIQLSFARRTNSALTDTARRRVIATMHTVLRDASWRDCSTKDLLYIYTTCLSILISCSEPSTFPPGEMAEEDTKWKPLVDVIAMAEDKLVKTLRSELLVENLKDSMKRMYMEVFFVRFRQIATRASEKMLCAVVDMVKDLQNDREEEMEYHEAWGDSMLQWLQLLLMNKQLAAKGRRKSEDCVQSREA